jgi:hypothetical protein
MGLAFWKRASIELSVEDIFFFPVGGGLGCRAQRKERKISRSKDTSEKEDFKREKGVIYTGKPRRMAWSQQLSLSAPDKDSTVTPQEQ